MKITVYRAGNKKEWRFRITARNNKIIATGEGYKNMADCLHTVRLMQERMKDADLEVLNGKDKPVEKGVENGG